MPKDRKQQKQKQRPSGADAPYKVRDKDDGQQRKSAQSHHRKRKPPHDDDMAPCSSFDEMNLKKDLLKGIYAYGFEKPSAIQQRAIRPIVRGRDVIAQSQAGTVS